MNKTLIKRSLATVTGAALALGQMAATFGTVNAAALTLTADKLISVPVEVPALPTDITGLEYVYETPVLAGESAWVDYADTFITTASSKGEINVSLDQIKDLLASTIAKTKKISEATIQDVLSGINDATAYAEGSKVVVKATLENVGDKIAVRMVRLMNRSGANLQGDYDFSGFQIAGDVVVTIDFGDYNKEVNVAIEFTDTEGRKYVVAQDGDDMYDYSGRKFKECVDLIDAQANLTETGKQRCYNYIDGAVEYLKNVDAAISAISGKAESADNKAFDVAYDKYVDACVAAIEKIDDSKLPNTGKNMRDTAIGRIPASLAACVHSNLVGKGYNAMIGIAADFGTEVDITIQDAIDVYKQAYDVKVTLDGFDGTADFSIPDNQNATVLAALQAEYADELAAQDLVLVGVDSHKEVKLYEENQEIAYYNVYRYIDKLYFEEIEETTTTESTTTTTESTTTTEGTTTTTTDSTGSSESSDTTTTTTDSTGSSESSDTTTTTTDSTGSSESSDTTTTTTTTDSTGSTESSDTTTTTTTTTDSTGSSESSDTTTTTTTSDSTGSSESSDTTTTTTTSDTTNSLAPAKGVESITLTLGNEGDENNLGYYWTDETKNFVGIDALMGSVSFDLEGGLREMVLLDENDLVAEYQNAASMNLIGYNKAQVAVKLTAAGLTKIQQTIAAEGYVWADENNTAVLADFFNTTNEFGHFNVTLVQRGNSDLDGNDGLTIDADDANQALLWYTRYFIFKYDYMNENTVSALPGSNLDYAGAYYACDVDGDGSITADDANMTLHLYLRQYVFGFDETYYDIENLEQVPHAYHADDMHSNPFYVVQYQQ